MVGNGFIPGLLVLLGYELSWEKEDFFFLPMILRAEEVKAYEKDANQMQGITCSYMCKYPRVSSTRQHTTCASVWVFRLFRILSHFLVAGSLLLADHLTG